MNITKKHLAVLGVIILIVVFGFSSPGQAFFKKLAVYFENISKEEISKRNFWLPSGRETYQIVQAEGVDPKIHEATIDPPDVHVGDTQKLSIIVSSEYNIESVVAKIETDNGIKELPLKFVKKVSNSELKPVKYAVNEKSELVILPEANNYTGLKSFLPTTYYSLPTNVASAHSPEDWDKLLYEESWVVHDTHDTTYHTTFVVKNVNGEESEITLAWSDACAIPRSGAWNITSNGNNCTISSPDGVELGNVTIQTYTLTLNAHFAWNPTYSVTMTSGAIAIGSGGQLRQSYVWEPDGDSDGYGRGSDYLVQDTQPANHLRRSAFGDPTDCNDFNADYFRTRNGLYRDSDMDRWYTGSIVNICSNDSGIYDGFAQWFTDDSVVQHIVDGSGPNGGYILGGSDANDSDPGVH